MLRFLIIFAIPILVTACSKSANAPQSDATAPLDAPRVVEPPPPTLGDWTKALTSTYKETKVEDKGDGVTEFVAKFNLSGNGIQPIAFGQRDAFRKLRFYSIGGTLQISTGVKSYISIKDGGRPVLFLQPYYWGPEWLFLNKVAILVDGEIALEKDCPDPDRDTKGIGIEEKCDFILTANELNSLRAIRDESKVSIRLTGKKGYASVGRDGYNPLRDFIRDIQSGIAIYDLIDNSVKDRLPPEVTVAP